MQVCMREIENEKERTYERELVKHVREKLKEREREMEIIENEVAEKDKNDIDSDKIKKR